MSDVPPTAGRRVDTSADTRRAMSRFGWLIVALALVGGIIGLVLAGGRPYEATSLVKVGASDVDLRILGLEPGEQDRAAQLAETMADLDQLRTARAARELLPDGARPSPTEIQQQIEVREGDGGQLIAITARSDSPFAASNLANAYAQAYITIAAQASTDRIEEIEGQLRSRLRDVQQNQEEAIAELSPEERDVARRLLLLSGDTEDAEIERRLELFSVLKRLPPTSVGFARAADTPLEPSGLPRFVPFLAGAGIGALLGLLGAWLLARRDDRVRTAPTAARLGGAPLLAAAPGSAAGSDRSGLPFGRLQRPEAQAALLAAAQLRLAPVLRDARTIAVAVPDDKTLPGPASTQLAGALARSPYRVLLVDPTDEPGGWERIEQVMHGVSDQTSPLGEEDGGEGLLHRLLVPPNALTDSRLAALREWALERYDRVVLLAPAPEQDASAASLVRAADAVVIAVTGGETGQRDLVELSDLASRLGTPVGGLYAAGL